MKITYDEILESMKLAFCNECAEDADGIGEVGARLQAVASELYSLACYEDYILRQSFPHTATGEYLDKHARLRSISRKKATAATVELTFSLSEPSSEGIIVPVGTICACSDKPYIQFKTTDVGIIHAGNLSARANARSIHEGEQYNVAAGKIDVMVNPPAGVASVTNAAKAHGGSDYESDEHLRARIINSYQVPSTGLNLLSMAGVVEAIDEVIECRIMKNGTTLDVYVRTAENTVSNALRTKITNVLFSATLLGLSVNIVAAQPVAVQVKALFKRADEAPSDVAEKIKGVVAGAVSGLGIGGRLELSTLIPLCLKLDGVEQISFSSGSAPNGIISINNNQYVSLSQDSIEVEFYE